VLVLWGSGLSCMSYQPYSTFPHHNYNIAIPPLTTRNSQYCCYEVFLPWVLAPDTHWPTEDDKKYNDKSIRNPACRYEFSDAKRCCLRCYRKPAWWVKEKYQERWGCVFGKKDEGGHQARDVRESIYFSPFGRGSFTLHGANWWEEEISVLHNSSP